MIPINVQPKRFIAALCPARALSNAKATKRRPLHSINWCNGATAMNSVAPTCAAPLARYGVSDSRGNNTLYSLTTTRFQSAYRHPPEDQNSKGVHFSTAALQPIQNSDSTSPENLNLNVSVFDASILSSEKVYQPMSLNLDGQRTDEWWTGRRPVFGECAGVAEDGCLYSLPQFTYPSVNEVPNDPTARAAAAAKVRASLQAYFDNTWTMTEVLLASLQGETAFMRPPYHDLRHPMIFYYGHPAALYINKLRVAGLLKQPINAYYEVIFETGVDEMSWDDLSKNEMAWPSVSEVHAYRRQVYDTVTTVIANLDETACLQMGPDSPLWALVLGFEHERIHIETSSFLISEMPQEFVAFPAGFPAYHATATDTDASRRRLTKLPLAGDDYPVNRMISVPETTITIGKSRDFPSFGWDNEYGQRTFTVPAFEASEFKVSNGEYWEFVSAGGYANRDYWTSAGWEWRAFRNVKWPTHWSRTGPQGVHEYELRLIFDSVPLEHCWAWPVVVNFHEAQAFAAWKNATNTNTGMDSNKYRVLTELEHRAIREEGEICSQETTGDHAAVFGGEHIMLQRGYNTNMACGSMTPVNALSPNNKGFSDVFGNAWEWCCDHFCALPGFKVHPHYEDFSTPCFDGLHNVIQGGSFMSTGNEASTHARFHFRPHFFQHAGFRLARELELPAAFGTGSGATGTGTGASSLFVEPTVTSDMDAPAPFVGSYPFRRSQAAIQADMAASGALQKQQQHNSLLLKHFGPPVEPPVQQSLGLAAAAPSITTSDNSSAMLSPSAGMTALSLRISQQAQLLGIDLSAAHIVDVGCGPGGLSFALARELGNKATILGFDHQAESIKCAQQLAEGGSVDCTLRGEGTLIDSIRITVLPDGVDTIAADDEGAAVAGGNVHFRMADPMCLPAELQLVDVVVLNDVLDTVSSPNTVLGRLGGVRGLVRPGGLLCVLSTYNWQESTTPKGLWLGGYLDDVTGAVVRSEETLQKRLSEDFDLVGVETLPMYWQDSQLEMRGKFYSLSFFQRK